MNEQNRAGSPMPEPSPSREVDTWVGRKARITPSGHIHLIERVRHRTRFGGDEITMACGTEVSRSYLTLHFPPAGRHCKQCFPPPPSAPDGAA